MPEEQEAKRILKEAADILDGKGNDYGSAAEAFADIAKVASVLRKTEFTAMDVAAVLLGLKLSRLGNLTARGIEPANESVEDTVKDCCNYVALFFEVLQAQLHKDTEDQPEKEIPF